MFGGSIWWKHTNLRPSGKPRIACCQCFFSDRNNADLAIIEVVNCPLPVFSVASLLCRSTWLIELVEKVGLRPPKFVLRRHSRGTVWYDLLHNSIRERGCCPSQHSLSLHDLSPRWWLSTALKATSDCLGDVVGVRACHTSSMDPPPLQTPPPRPCIYLGFTRTRNFCKFCRTFIPVPGTSAISVRQCHSIFIPARNFCKFCTPVPQYPEHLEDFHTGPHPEVL